MIVVAAVLLLIGSLLTVVAALGLIRLPDVFGRMHAATKPAVLGLLCVLVGAALVLGDASSGARLLLAASLQLVTAPVAMHTVGRAVQRRLVIDGELARAAGEHADQVGAVRVRGLGSTSTDRPRRGVMPVEDDVDQQ